MARGYFYVFLTAVVVANQLFFSSSLAMHRRCMAREEGGGGPHDTQGLHPVLYYVAHSGLFDRVRSALDLGAVSFGFGCNQLWIWVQSVLELGAVSFGIWCGQFWVGVRSVLRTVCGAAIKA